MKKFYTTIFVGILIASCSTDNNSTKPIEEIIEPEPTELVKTIPISEVNRVIEEIPSAHEITATIKASGAPFSALALNNPQHYSHYSTNYRKAINLGIYSTDIGYVGIYKRKDLMNDYLKVINDLAHDIDLGHFMDKQRIDRIMSSPNMADSIFPLTSEIFKKMDIYLRENDRHKTGLLLVVGSWLEAIHMTATIAYNSENGNATLSKKIAEQKFVLDKFILLLNNYRGNTFFNQLIGDLAELKILFDSIKLTEKDLASSRKINKDTLNTTPPQSPAEITDTQLAKITIKLEDIRKNITEPV